MKPCPFCGDNAPFVAVHQTDTANHVWIGCSHCAARGSCMSDTRDLNGDFEKTEDELRQDAIDAWNERYN